MNFFTKKRDFDVASIISVAAAAVILTFFSAWLYYSTKIEKMESSYEIKIELVKANLEDFRIRNRELEKKLAKVKDAMTEEESAE